MSLKAKLEAVIYAAEEPVTLAQLAALFADEALAYKAEQAAKTAESEPQPQVEEGLPLLEEGFAYLGLEQTPAFYTAADGAPASEKVGAGVAGGGVGAETADEGKSESGAAAAEPAAGNEAGTQSAGDRSAPPEAGSAAAQSEGGDAGAPVDAAEPESQKMAEAAADPEAAQKREARQREREIRAILQSLIDELIADSATDNRGVEIREIAGGFRMATKAEYHDAVRGFVRSMKPPLKLSLQALETLAVVAYKQPVTAPEVSEVRGVESAGTLGSLLSRKLIATAGRKQVIGRPILYKTTREFLLRFGLKDVSELPSMEEFEKMAAIELDEQATAEADAAAGEEAAEPEEVEAGVEQGSEAAAELAAEESPEGNTAAETTPAESETSKPAETEAPGHEP